MKSIRIFQSIHLLLVTAILIASMQVVPVVPAVAAVSAATIGIGDYVKMGRYYGEPILWRCVDLDGNGPMLLADRILTLKPFDAKGNHKYLDGTAQADDAYAFRTSLGSNLWETSSMRSWLNSSAAAGSVTWLAGCPPTAANVYLGMNDYASEQGFLADGNFTASERAAIRSVPQKSVLSGVDAAKLNVDGTTKHLVNSGIASAVQNFDIAYYQNVTDRMFLLDVRQISRVYLNSAALGTGYYIGKPTRAAVEHSEIRNVSLSAETCWSSLLRTPNANSSSSVRMILSDGTVNSGSAASNGSFGVRPAFYLDLSTAFVKSGYGTAEFPYAVDTTMPGSADQVTLSKAGDGFAVTIAGWTPDHRYQIWTWQKVESGIFDGESQPVSQWILSQNYTLGSDRSASGFIANADGTIGCSIGAFESPGENYTVAVKVLDENGQFLAQRKNTYTAAQAGEVVIRQILVDDDFAEENGEDIIRRITPDAAVSLLVSGNGVAGTVYRATVDSTGEILMPAGGADSAADGDADGAADDTASGLFHWDISSLQPGRYSVTVTAQSGAGTDSRTIFFNLFKIDDSILYGEMEGLAALGSASGEKFSVLIDPALIRGPRFRYTIGEPWRTAVYQSPVQDAPLEAFTDDHLLANQYGTYQVTAYALRTGSQAADDGAFCYVSNPRPGSHTLEVSVDGVEAGDAVMAGTRGVQVNIVASGLLQSVGGADVRYSFWRRDANGWSMIRDYGADGVFAWRPGRIGLYTIQVRARGPGAGSYELIRNVELDISEPGGDAKAVVSAITINQSALDGDAAARRPVLITAAADSSGTDLLYKFIITNGFVYYVETAYSADPTYTWIPAKAGEYTIAVLVKSMASFGKYDAVREFTVDVNP
ncbi:MAG: DUF6273 domain-containing protein [Saccharofermentanales bacterium]